MGSVGLVAFVVMDHPVDRNGIFVSVAVELLLTRGRSMSHGFKDAADGLRGGEIC